MIRKRIGKPPSDVVVCFYSRGPKQGEKRGGIAFHHRGVAARRQNRPSKNTLPCPMVPARVNLNFGVLDRYILLDAAFFSTK